MRRSTNITAEALENVRLFTSNVTADVWENINVSVSKLATTTAEDVFVNVRDTVDASATDVSVDAGDTLDVVSQNKATMMTTDFWLSAGHALDAFAQVQHCSIAALQHSQPRFPTRHTF